MTLLFTSFVFCLLYCFGDVFIYSYLVLLVLKMFGAYLVPIVKMWFRANIYNFIKS